MDYEPFWTRTELRRVYTECVRNAEPIEEEIKPLIFMHGFNSFSGGYSAICTDIASHGYLVLCPDSHDGSCSYTETDLLDPQPVHFECESLAEIITSQMRKRKIELESLIDFLFSGSIDKKLGV